MKLSSEFTLSTIQYSRLLVLNHLGTHIKHFLLKKLNVVILQIMIYNILRHAEAAFNYSYLQAVSMVGAMKNLDQPS